MSRRRENCFPAPRKSSLFSVEEKCVGFPGAGGSCVPAPESSRARFWRGSGARFRRACRFSRRRGKLCAGAEKAVSRRREKVTLIHYGRKINRFSRRWRKLCPGAGKAVSRRARSHSFSVEEKNAGFPGAGGSCVPAPGKLFPAPGKAVSRRRESCFPAPWKAVSRPREV